MPLIRKPRGADPGAEPQPTDTVEGLASQDAQQRWMAARQAADNPESLPALAAALRVESIPRVREAMFTSLARIGTRAAALEVLPLLRSDDAHSRAGALDALRIMIRNSRELLPPLLADADVDVRVLSCELARALPGDEASPLLCDVLRQERDANVCAAALDVLAEVGQRSALPVLKECAIRFANIPFLAFAIQATVDRINAESPRIRG